MSKSIRVVGIETSCDETAAAVVDSGRHILSNAVATQIAIHQPYAGIVPELASRAHAENIQSVLELAFKGQTARHQDPFPKSFPADVIAVTSGPGLMGSLLVGKAVAEMLAWVYDKPLVSVNHLEGHIYSVLPGSPELEPPFLALLVSGGHTELVHVKGFGQYNVLGRTRDDAAGEAFDKVAKMLNLGYPGGPVIDRLATKGNPKAIAFPRPFLNDGWDFSFSGLKTAVLYYLRDNPGVMDSKKKIADVCASFQAAVVDVLVGKTMLAAEKLGVKHVVMAGGVAANTGLREAFVQHAKGHKIHAPSPLLCTDNAVMIAVAGYYKFQKVGPKKFVPTPVVSDSTLALADWK
jgi:N6-L-threonylcarbamoyladenine synthase